MSSEYFNSKDKDLGIQGRISMDHGQMIQGLMEESTLELQLSCSIDVTNAPSKSKKVFLQRPCSLTIIVYGPFELFKEIGGWFQEYNVYLQDPVNANKSDLKYCNPHRLSAEDMASCPMVSELVSQKPRLIGFEEIRDRPDFLDMLSSHAELPEAPQPTTIRTDLKRSERKKHVALRAYANA